MKNNKPPSKSNRNPIRIGGLPVLPLTNEGWAKMIWDEAERRKSLRIAPAIYCGVNGNVIALAAKNGQFRKILDDFDGMYADGQPLVLASKLMKRRLPERVTSADSVHFLAESAIRRRKNIFFLGAKQEYLDLGISMLMKKYPKLAIAGVRNGYFSEIEVKSILSEIRESEADLVWVCTGMPSDHYFIHKYRSDLIGCGVLRTGGGLIDWLAGRVPRAPAIIQNLGLEWLHRTIMEPRRLAWRYTTTNPIAAYKILTDSSSFPKRADTD